jgi:hypothetical protein
MSRCASAAGTSDEPKGSAVESNLLRMEKCIASMTREILGQVPVRRGDSVGLAVLASDERWLFEGAIAAALKEDSLSVFASPDSAAPFRMDITASSVTLRYTNMFRDGMFGAQKVRREISAEMTATVTRLASREVLYSGTMKREAADSVKVEAVPTVESDGIPATRATLPSENGVDRFVEPFVIIGATAVAIFLLFSVRS